MRIIMLSLLFLLLVISRGSGQDQITTTTGVAFEAKIDGETETHIRYKKAASPNSVFTMPKADIHLIKYENGSQLFLNPVVPVPTSLETQQNQPILSTQKPLDPATRTDTMTSKQLYTLGKIDADLYYKGYKTAGTFTFISTFLVWPAGIITAVSTASSPPKATNFTMPDAGLRREPEYIRGYHGNVRRIKSRKVWTNFVAGFGSSLFVAALIISR